MSFVHKQACLGASTRACPIPGLSNWTLSKYVQVLPVCSTSGQSVRCRRLHAAVRPAAASACRRRWWGLLSVGQQRALACALLGGEWASPPQLGENLPSLASLLADGEASAPSLLPAEQGEAKPQRLTGKHRKTGGTWSNLKSQSETIPVQSRSLQSDVAYVARMLKEKCVFLCRNSLFLTSLNSLQQDDFCFLCCTVFSEFFI